MFDWFMVQLRSSANRYCDVNQVQAKTTLGVGIIILASSVWRRLLHLLNGWPCLRKGCDSGMMLEIEVR